MFGKIRDKLKSVFKKSEEVVGDKPLLEESIGEKLIVEKLEEIPKTSKEKGSKKVVSKPRDKVKVPKRKLKKDFSELEEISEIEQDMLKDVSFEEKEAIFEKKELEKGVIEENKHELESKIFREEDLEKQIFEDISKNPDLKRKELVEEVPMPEIIEELKIEKKEGFFSKAFGKLKSKKITEEDFSKIWLELEIFLLEINISFNIVQNIEGKLREALIGDEFDRFKLSERIREVLEEEVESVLVNCESDFLKAMASAREEGEPLKILILGVNGTGKTTTIAKIVKFLQDNNFKTVVAAADTFRAAAVEQLEEHSKKLKFKLVMHKHGNDPAAVAFDAISHAKAKNLDVVLIDTAGRMPNNANLMMELSKIKRVSKANMTIFIGDSVSGNDLEEQISLFDKVLKIDGLILTKVDTDERPGSIVTAAYTIDKPIFFLGTGQNYEDFVKFDSKIIAKKLFEVE